MHFFIHHTCRKTATKINALQQEAKSEAIILANAYLEDKMEHNTRHWDASSATFGRKQNRARDKGMQLEQMVRTPEMRVAVREAVKEFIALRIKFVPNQATPQPAIPPRLYDVDEFIKTEFPSLYVAVMRQRDAPG